VGTQSKKIAAPENGPLTFKLLQTPVKLTYDPITRRIIGHARQRHEVDWLQFANCTSVQFISYEPPSEENWKIGFL